MIYETKIEIPYTARPVLHAMHIEAGRDTSCSQSIRGGTQINLTRSNHKSVLKIRRLILSSIQEMLNERVKFKGLWSIRMFRGGHHVAHNHPQGWMSGVVYVDVPDTKSATLELDGGRHVRPESGKLVLFPSFLLHRTTIYQSESPRLTVAFDLEKA